MPATKKVSPKDRATDLRLRRHYGITIAKYNLLLKFQKGCCAMCKLPPKDGSKRLAVDHDHKTGMIRGLLCMMCNRALGKFRDNDLLVVNAAEYVTNPPATCAFGGACVTAPGRVGTKKRAKLLAKLIQEEKSKKGAE